VNSAPGAVLGGADVADASDSAAAQVRLAGAAVIQVTATVCFSPRTPSDIDLSRSFIVAADGTRLTCTADHSWPRGVEIPHSFSAAAMLRKETMPAARISAMIGVRSAARAVASFVDIPKRARPIRIGPLLAERFLSFASDGHTHPETK